MAQRLPHQRLTKNIYVSFDILLVVVVVRLAGPFSLLEPTAFPSGFSVFHYVSCTAR